MFDACPVSFWTLLVDTERPAISPPPVKHKSNLRPGTVSIRARLSSLVTIYYKYDWPWSINPGLPPWNKNRIRGQETAMFRQHKVAPPRLCVKGCRVFTGR